MSACRLDVCYAGRQSVYEEVLIPKGDADTHGSSQPQDLELLEWFDNMGNVKTVLANNNLDSMVFVLSST
jgi:hypothetical protein